MNSIQIYEILDLSISGSFIKQKYLFYTSCCNFFSPAHCLRQLCFGNSYLERFLGSAGISIRTLKSCVLQQLTYNYVFTSLVHAVQIVKIDKLLFFSANETIQDGLAL